MASKYQFAALVFVVYLSVLLPFVAAAHAVTYRSPTVPRPANTAVEKSVEVGPDAETLINDLHDSIANRRAYESIKIIGELAKLGPDARPAMEILVDLLGKQLPDCREEERLCPDKTQWCPVEKRLCPENAEILEYDYLTIYAAGALREIGADALPRLSMAVNETSEARDWKRRQLVADVMVGFGPAAIPFFADMLLAQDRFGTRRLALIALNTLLAQNPASANQLEILVPYVTPFLQVGDLEGTDPAINILGAIGPGAAAAVPQLVPLLNYKRELEGFGACTVGERLGFIFREETITALVKIGTPEALNAVEQCKRESETQTEPQLVSSNP